MFFITTINEEKIVLTIFILAIRSVDLGTAELRT